MTKVAVTTDRFEEVADSYRRQGLTPISMPTIRVEPAEPDVLDAAREAAEGAALMLATSPRTIRMLWPHGEMPPIPVAAVGEVTSTAVVDAGGRPTIVGRAGLADLVDLMMQAGVPDRIVFPRAAGSATELLSPLVREGVEILAFDVYRSVPVAPAGDLGVEAATFASPSAVEGWILGRDFDGLVLAVIGATTEAALLQHASVAVVAPRPSHEAMAIALASYLRESA